MGFRSSGHLFFYILFILPFAPLFAGRQIHLTTPLIQNEQHSPQQNSWNGEMIPFRLASVYATTNSSRILFADVGRRDELTPGLPPPSYSIRTRKVPTHKPSSLQAFNQARLSSYSLLSNATAIDTPLWEEDEVLGPDITDRETILLLAKMTNNAYNIDKEEDDWYDIGDEWKVFSFISRRSALT